MEYGRIDLLKKPISKIIYGTAQSSFICGEDCNQLLDEMFALGINTFDTARVYKKSENVIGKWMQEKGNREEVVIVSKCGHPNVFQKRRMKPSCIKKDLKKSLQELQSDYIDIYLLHRDDVSAEVGQIVETMNELLSEGRIRCFGASNWERRRVEQANEYAYKNNLTGMKVSSPNFSVGIQKKDPWGGGCVSISGKEKQEDREWYEKEEISIFAYSSLARGLFSGKFTSNDIARIYKELDAPGVKGYACEENFIILNRCEVLADKYHCGVAQIALAYIFSKQKYTYAIVSSGKAARMRSNSSAAEMKLSEEDIAFLEKG